MVEYYRQRASAGLIISEGVPVSDRGRGYLNTGALWNEAQAGRLEKGQRRRARRRRQDFRPALACRPDLPFGISCRPQPPRRRLQ